MSAGNDREFIDYQQNKEREGRAMLCPLFTTSSIDKGGQIDYKRWECLKEECAWWDGGSDACAIWSIMSGLDALGKLFREIEQKMPHEE